MGIRSTYFHEFGVTLNVYSGTIDRGVMMEFIASRLPLPWTRWVNHLLPSMELALTAEDMPVIRRMLAEKLSGLHGDAEIRSALVCEGPAHSFLLHFWPSYVGREVRYPVDPVAFRTLEGACNWLGLSNEAREALSAAVTRPCRQ